MAATILMESDSYNSADGATLVVATRTGVIREYQLGDVTTLGRENAGLCKVLVNSPIVSGRHGELLRLDRDYIYRDVNASNGTFINGVRYGGNPSFGGRKEAYRLKNGDVLRVDRSDLANAREEAVVMIFCRGELQNTWQEALLPEDADDIPIGRGEHGAEALRFSDKTVSAHHAMFHHGASGSWSVADCGSTNGVFVNNRRIETATQLHIMDVIRIGEIHFLYLGNRMLYNGTLATGERLVIHVRRRQVNKGLFQKKVLLSGIRFSAESGDMVLILGGAGAGKSTLIKAIAGYEKSDSDVYLDGDGEEREPGREPENMPGLKKLFAKKSDSHDEKLRLAMVRQFSDKIKSDSVYHTLMDAARTRMPHADGVKQEERVEEVTKLLDLTHQLDTLVGQLSGGQLKRLDIAVGMLADPKLFILDEPDSGLDGPSANGVMLQLRKIADLDKIVMVITHTPDRIPDLYNKVLVIAKSSRDQVGHMAFFGTPKDAMAFFGTDSMEGIVARVNGTDENGRPLADHFIEKYDRLQQV